MRVTALAAALGGCMKIYPDPELPDVEVTWFAEDCRTGTGDVVVSLIGLDDPAAREDASAACSGAKYTFADVARQRFRVDGALLTANGEPFSKSVYDVDLRNGLDQTASLFFGGFANVRIAWTFDMGASCQSLAADAVMIDFTSDEEPEPFGFGVPCDATPFTTTMPDGVYTVTLRALAGTATVAISPPSSPFAVDQDSLADTGTLVMSPCGASCP